MNIQTLKGFRDFLPSESKKRQYVINTLKKVFESFGFEPLETPALEYDEILTGKYGDEGDKLMYRFEDNGGRKVALRYDQTVPLSRVIAQYHNNLAMPFKRYQIQPVWRAENTQKGRFREFIQCDIDTVGSTSPLSDAEILSCVSKAYEALGFKKFTIILNDRSTFKGLPVKAIIAIDKLKKIGEGKVKDELEKLGLSGKLLQKIKEKEPNENLQMIMKLASEMDTPSLRIKYDPTLARGLDYYTGLIFEVEVDDYSVGSVGGGGRYDKLIGMFSRRDIPAVGFAFGFDRIIEAMTELAHFPKNIPDAVSRVLITVFDKDMLPESLQTVTFLRQKGIPAEVYLSEDTAMQKQLKYANDRNIPYVIIIGEEELKKDKVILRNMETREQKEVSPHDLPLLLT